ncbi:hypothetical protein ACX80H_07730 [Arthrobacter sp. MDT2-2]
MNLPAPEPDQPGTTLLRGGHPGTAGTSSSPEPSNPGGRRATAPATGGNAGDPQTMAGALVFAVRDVLPAAGRLDAKAIAVELDRGLRAYWGPDHGITTSEMLATARDIKTSAAAATLN